MIEALRTPDARFCSAPFIANDTQRKPYGRRKSMGLLLLWELYLSKKHKIFRLVQGPIVVVAVGIICQFITKSFSFYLFRILSRAFCFLKNSEF